MILPSTATRIHILFRSSITSLTCQSLVRRPGQLVLGPRPAHVRRRLQFSLNRFFATACSLPGSDVHLVMSPAFLLRKIEATVFSV